MNNILPPWDSPSSAATGARALDIPSEAAVHEAGQSLRRELADLKSELDALISHAATLSDGELSEAYARILARLGASGAVARIAARDPGPKRAGGYATARAYITRRPLRTLAAASMVGMLAGWLARPKPH